MTGRSPSYRDLLGIADLPVLLAATILARLADGMLLLTIVLYALERYASLELAGWPAFAAAAGLTGLVLGLLVAGTAAGPINVGVLTLRQRRTDPAQLGHVMSVSISLNVAGLPIGSALAGALITHSVPWAFAAAGVSAALAALATKMIPKDEGMPPADQGRRESAHPSRRAGKTRYDITRIAMPRTQADYASSTSANHTADMAAAGRI